MKIKPKAKRVAMTVPLDTKGPNYNEDADDALKMKQLTLQSRPGHLSTTHALGVVRSAISLQAKHQENIKPLTSPSQTSRDFKPS